MFSDNYSFPHPVLGLSDDITGTFDISLKVKRNDADRRLRFSDINCQIENQYIQELLETAKAGLLFKIYCSSTFQTWTFLNPKDSFEIDENDLYNKIEIEAFIVSTEKITNYSDSSFNSQFHGFTFSLDENEVLAISGKVTMNIEKADEELGLGNIFKFYSHQIVKPIEFSYNQDKIHIIYPKDGENHPPNALFKSNPWSAYNFFILPALEGAFDFATNVQSEAEGYEWYTILTNLYPKDQWDTSNHYYNAQKFLKDKLPIIKAYRELSNQN